MVMIERKDPVEAGFSLVELLIAMLIIALLITIALPTFLGARERSQGSNVQSALRNGLATAKTWHAVNDTYAGFDETQGEAIEPSLAWVALADPAVGEVAVGLVSASDVHLVGESASGRFFCLHDDVAVGTTYGEGGTFPDVDEEAECGGPSW
jgi:type IV pilus assembly protein PilA